MTNPITPIVAASTDDRLAAHGLRRCNVARYDHAVIKAAAERKAMALLIDAQLGPLHPGYTVSESVALSCQRINQPSHNPDALASALTLRSGGVA